MCAEVPGLGDSKCMMTRERQVLHRLLDPPWASSCPVAITLAKVLVPGAVEASAGLILRGAPHK